MTIENKPEGTTLFQSKPKTFCRHAGYSGSPSIIFCYVKGDNVQSDQCSGCRKFQRDTNEACYGG